VSGANSLVGPGLAIDNLSGQSAPFSLAATEAALVGAMIGAVTGAGPAA